MGRSYTWEMIRGSGGNGVVVKDDTESGRKYLERKKRDQKNAQARAHQRLIAPFVEPPWFCDTELES
jgi:hypothetical protein